MRTALLVVLALAPSAACTDALVTEPRPEAPRPAGVSPAAVVVRGAGGRLTIGNEADIERVEIVRGAAATPLYGKQCDMVIVVRTRPPAGQPQSAAVPATERR